MNSRSAKFLGLVYRKEPISGFILILGITDATIGGVSGHWSLLSVGITLALIGLLTRWRQTQKTTEVVTFNPARHLLPPNSSRPPLPFLISEKGP
ncbi:hypothetical protein [Myxosarcina sp. GI1]|uniref:hypothetical protein n=1 Tax=Myxosarcina sp. GI1 TaxID=1541065 RepID=UPI0005674954|nr:hypothetical protein [Myxosarcina sp. GI1]